MCKWCVLFVNANFCHLFIITLYILFNKKKEKKENLLKLKFYFKFKQNYKLLIFLQKLSSFAVYSKKHFFWLMQA